MSARIDLTEAEMQQALQVAVQRASQNALAARQNAYGAKDSLDTHAVGALGEMAVAKYLNRFWSGSLGDIKAADIGPHYQARSTDLARGGLVVHPNDKDDHKFVLVVVNRNHCTLHAWAWGRDAKQPHFWNTTQLKDRPAFLVPQGHEILTPIYPRETAKVPA